MRINNNISGGLGRPPLLGKVLEEPRMMEETADLGPKAG